MINIACVFKEQNNPRGENYSIDWVNKLYRGVKRNLTVPFNFVCLSNVQTPYDTIELISDSDIYWNKIEIFRSDLFDAPTLYLDLDVVICNSIDSITKLPDQFLMVREPYRNITNSSVMYFNGDYSFLYNNYISNRQNIIEEYKNAGLRYGDQAYIGENVSHGYIEDYIDLIGWKHHKIDSYVPGKALLIFTSREKPYTNLDLIEVKNNWI